MPTRHLATVLVSAAAAVFFASRQTTGAQQDSLPHPETQRVLFENAFVRVFDIRVPAGTFEPNVTRSSVGMSAKPDPTIVIVSPRFAPWGETLAIWTASRT